MHGKIKYTKIALLLKIYARIIYSNIKTYVSFKKIKLEEFSLANF